MTVQPQTTTTNITIHYNNITHLHTKIKKKNLTAVRWYERYGHKKLHCGRLNFAADESTNLEQDDMEFVGPVLREKNGRAVILPFPSKINPAPKREKEIESFQREENGGGLVFHSAHPDDSAFGKEEIGPVLQKQNGRGLILHSVHPNDFAAKKEIPGPAYEPLTAEDYDRIFYHDDRPMDEPEVNEGALIHACKTYLCSQDDAQGDIRDFYKSTGVSERFLVYFVSHRAEVFQTFTQEAESELHCMTRLIIKNGDNSDPGCPKMLETAVHALLMDNGGASLRSGSLTLYLRQKGLMVVKLVELLKLSNRFQVTNLVSDISGASDWTVKLNPMDASSKQESSTSNGNPASNIKFTSGEDKHFEPLPDPFAPDNKNNGNDDHINGKKDQPNGKQDQLNGKKDQPNGKKDQLNGRKDQLSGRNDQLNGKKGQLNGRKDASSPSNFSDIGKQYLEASKGRFSQERVPKAHGMKTKTENASGSAIRGGTMAPRNVPTLRTPGHLTASVYSSKSSQSEDSSSDTRSSSPVSISGHENDVDIDLSLPAPLPKWRKQPIIVEQALDNEVDLDLSISDGHGPTGAKATQGSSSAAAKTKKILDNSALLAIDDDIFADGEEVDIFDLPLLPTSDVAARRKQLQDFGSPTSRSSSEDEERPPLSRVRPAKESNTSDPQDCNEKNVIFAHDGRRTVSEQCDFRAPLENAPEPVRGPVYYNIGNGGVTILVGNPKDTQQTLRVLLEGAHRESLPLLSETDADSDYDVDGRKEDRNRLPPQDGSHAASRAVSDLRVLMFDFDDESSEKGSGSVISTFRDEIWKASLPCSMRKVFNLRFFTRDLLPVHVAILVGSKDLGKHCSVSVRDLLLEAAARQGTAGTRFGPSFAWDYKLFRERLVDVLPNEQYEAVARLLDTHVSETKGSDLEDPKETLTEVSFRKDAGMSSSAIRPVSTLAFVKWIEARAQQEAGKMRPSSDAMSKGRSASQVLGGRSTADPASVDGNRTIPNGTPRSSSTSTSAPPVGGVEDKVGSPRHSLRIVVIKDVDVKPSAHHLLRYFSQVHLFLNPTEKTTADSPDASSSSLHPTVVLSCGAPQTLPSPFLATVNTFIFHRSAQPQDVRHLLALKNVPADEIRATIRTVQALQGDGQVVVYTDRGKLAEEGSDIENGTDRVDREGPRKIVKALLRKSSAKRLGPTLW